MNFNFKIIPLSLALSLSLFNASSQAHVGFDNDQAIQGSYKRFALKVPHGCGTLATNTLTIHIPEGIQGAKPMPKSGWSTSILSAKLKTPYDNHGTPVIEDVNALTWSNGSLPSNFFDEFIFQAKVASQQGTLYFDVDQSCGSTTTLWNGKSHDDAHPAASLHVIEPMATPAKAHQH